MRKYFLLLAVFILFFYFSLQDVKAQAVIGSYCDSRPNGFLSGCSECASTCDYTAGLTSPCKASDCPAGTVFVDCYPADILFFTVGYRLNCMNLQCGDAGVPSGNTCVQQSSLDSSCVNQITHNYGWTDNYGLSAPAGKTPCECYYTYTATTPQYNKKADGTVCYKSGGTGTCESGICKPKATGCINPSSYTNSNNCNSAGCYWCAPPTYSGYCAASSGDCKASCTKDSDCPSSCDSTGCSLNSYKCSYGNCVYSGISTYCGQGTKGCAGGTTCDYSAGSCGGGTPTTGGGGGSGTSGSGSGGD